MTKSCDAGLDGRCRDLDGAIRRKNGSTRVKTLRTKYGSDFVQGVRGDAKLNTVLKRAGEKSLHQLMRRQGR